MNQKILLHILLATIFVAYTIIGTLYAVFTPAWQVPDEPAHYNYVRQLAEGQGLPVMKPGDYDHDYLSYLKLEKFPPELSVDTIEYEDHQPPVYYLLATPVYLVSGGAILPLRLLSVLFGIVLLALTFRAVQAIFPAQPALALAAVAFVAFIPQHVAMTAGVSNDTLAEVMVAITLWVLILYVGGKVGHTWLLGLLLAVALLTKGSIYVVVPLALLTIVVRRQRERQTWHWAAAQAASMLVPALVFSAPWFIRNVLIYGWPDLTGQGRHDIVVEGQMRPLDFVALEGWSGYWRRAIIFTFRSFWGQFGWMGVVLPARVYQALTLLSVILIAGFVWWIFDRKRPRLTPVQRDSLILLLASGLLTALMYLWYNTKFLQHQGRYLFPALVPLGAAVALSLERLTGVLPRCLRPWVPGALFATLALLDIYCLFEHIVPTLAR
jgi:4-amino-4-deoxy-L-arabinose transferase-like glycosyltransferase